LTSGIFRCQNHGFRERRSFFRPTKTHNDRTTSTNPRINRTKCMGTSAIY
jgi:hypothetical protein